MIIYKPQTRKGPVFLSDRESSPPTITLSDGRVITAVRADQAGGVYKGHEGYQWVFPNDVLGQQGAILSFGGQQQQLGNTNMSYRGGSVGGLSESSKGAIGDMSSGGGGFGATQVGQYGYAPANLMGQFPSPFLTNYQPIQAAPYKFTDAKKFAEKFGEFNRGELNKNYGQSKAFALDTLDTELQSLRGYVPAASALKRQETAADNQFNQQQRTQQLDTALPEVRGQLQAQGQRAETYANGRLPDSVQDRAYELGVRSGAADIAAAGGFGARSSVARKASDLMSAKERLGLSQYGDQLLTGNINQRANIELAPTEYSNAGSQINVNPSQSFSQLQGSNFSQINQSTLISPSTAYQGDIQQNQFTTSQEQGTRQFNASNTLQNDQFNATNQNSFALQQFGYATSLAGAYAGASQTDLNTGVAVDQQNKAEEVFNQSKEEAQSSGQVGGILEGLGSLIPVVTSIFGGPEAGAVAAEATKGGVSTSDIITGTLTGQTGLDKLGSALGLRSTTTPSTAAATLDSEPSRAAVVAESAPVLSSAGISSTPQAGSISVGVDNEGSPVYASAALLKNNDSTVGSNLISRVKSVVEPFNVLSSEDSAKLDAISSEVSKPETLRMLDAAVQNKNKEQFVNKTLSAVKDRSKAASSTASELYQYWPQMSDSQKSLGLAALGVKNYKTSDGTSLNAKEIRPGLTVGKGIELASQGYNPYSLAKNWDQLQVLQKDAGVGGDVTQMASTAKTLGLLGYGKDGAAVPKISEGTLQSLGATPVSQYGVGALSVPAGKTIPNGYRSIARTKEGTTVIVPAANAKSVAPGTNDIVNGATSISAGAHNIYKTWIKKDVKTNSPNGALGGSAMVAGLNDLKGSNPVLYRKLIGSTIDAKSSDKLEFASKLGGSTLGKLLSGGSGKEANAKGNSFSKDALEGIDAKSLTPDSYNKLIRNQRSLYAKEGIKSQSDGYQLANQAYAEGRINDAELVAAQQALDMIFGNNSYEDARKLLAGEEGKSATPAKTGLKFSGLPNGVSSKVFTRSRFSNQSNNMQAG